MAEFSLLTLNTFGLPFYLGWNRLNRIARELDQLPMGIFCLQEIQQNAFVSTLDRRLPHHKYHAYEYGWFAPKGGLFTAAREPLQSSEFVAYENRGRPLSAGFADWALNKGVLVSRTTIEGRAVVVMNTHIHANYVGDWSRTNSMAQIQRDQILHLARLINQQPADAIVITCGDFNFPRSTFLYEELVDATGVIDPLRTDPRPTYRPMPLIPTAKWSVPIDFCFVRLPQASDVELRADVVQVEDTTTINPAKRFLSDHNAITLHVSW